MAFALVSKGASSGRLLDWLVASVSLLFAFWCERNRCKRVWCNKDPTVSDDESLKGLDFHCGSHSFYTIAARERGGEKLREVARSWDKWRCSTWQ